MQLQITSQSLYYVRTQYTVMWVTTKHLSETVQRFLNANNPKLNFLSAIKGNSALVPQAGCLIYLPPLWSQTKIFHNLVNSIQVW